MTDESVSMIEQAGVFIKQLEGLGSSMLNHFENKQTLSFIDLVALQFIVEELLDIADELEANSDTV